MREFIHIPKEIWPKEKEHIDYETVYRAIKHNADLTNDDFLPWNIEHHNQMKTFKNQFHQPCYGMSVFTDLHSLISLIQKLPSLKKKTKSIAKGRTTIERGISKEEDENHHVEYFIYDYINNNPKVDFSICILSNELEQMVNDNE